MFAIIEKKVMSEIVGQYFVIGYAQRAMKVFEKLVKVLGRVCSAKSALINTYLNILPKKFKVSFINFLGILV